MNVPQDPDAAPFWDALEGGELRLQYSPSSGRWQFPPLERCRHSGGPLEWRTIPPQATIVTFIEQNRPVSAEFAALVPYIIALVEPDAAPGVRLPVTLLDADRESVAVGARVEIGVARSASGKSPLPVARLVEAKSE